MPTSDHPPPALELIGLVKRFGAKTAVHDVTLAVPAGSFYGLVGPNGAGKTTSLSMAVGLLRPDAGHARIFGADVWADPVGARSRVGVLPDGLALPERLTGRELLVHLARLRGLSRDTAAARAEELLDLLDLLDAERTLVNDYSTGMRKKIGLATALLHGPRLLVLDEPFEAVDPVSALTIRGMLRAFVDGGGSVVLSSHVMALVEQLCDRVAVIAAGRVVAAGTIAEVRAGDSLEDRFVELVGAGVTGRRAPSWLAS
ncbi:ABC transporter ATP-binding protein [Actinoplanes couchii]|uniref:ABC transporter ATP-binding protein n=1 Tax=Actinoplanes couchii TaxID=403638 RepID=A0ABQ3X739_9ACTN|nr:ABC transporter ATP-binding protein [Actinoplanes couchii]MDR6322049.1 ABC-2 type transport system ATP-binding protein [Actinoplanes couchii]GID54213.1 ABC transporter ATP-binding protein [Actinoplanes couchii]